MRAKENSPGLLSFESFLKSIYVNGIAFLEFLHSSLSANCVEPPKMAQDQAAEVSNDESEDEYAFLMTEDRHDLLSALGVMLLNSYALLFTFPFGSYSCC
jgi:hypothetical protein